MEPPSGINFYESYHYNNSLRLEYQKKTTVQACKIVGVGIGGIVTLLLLNNPLVAVPVFAYMLYASAKRIPNSTSSDYIDYTEFEKKAGEANE
ncbi:MAG: hypothetical protein ABIC91_08340 [Nanoarchaeota archaeon]|nr:hypothetical protein [Nanoarchaeota archaeon]MBU1030354.1 hypothetical protein [Nanoarchaeota archaeon]MBU1849814.1 hypothetical protein [Nanoarchaeota archaeon]